MGSKKKTISRKKINENSILYISLALFIVVFSILRPSFFSFSNINAVLQSMASLAVLSISSVFILTIGEIDISNGAIMSVAPCVISLLVLNNYSILISIIVALAIVLVLGFLNGFFVAKIGVPSFITTLGTQGIAMGLTRTITYNRPIQLENQEIIKLFNGSIGSIPNSVLWMLAMFIVAFIILYKTRFGRSLHCIGDNVEAAAMYGLDIKKLKTSAFIVSSGFIVIAGMMESFRSSYIRAGVGENLMLYSIVVALIGGCSVKGGKSNIIGAFVGALFVSMVRNGLFLLSMTPYMQNIIIGLVIISVLATNAIVENRERELKKI